MGVTEVVATGIICSLILYNIKRTDDVDARIDKFSDRLTHIEVLLPKRKSDTYYHSENSGIDL